MNFNILNSTGGISYHMRAIVNRRRWRPFCDYIENWLFDWMKEILSSGSEPGTLVLVGPNAGYTLPFNFISRFRQVIAVEPDPLAFALFNMRFQLRSQIQDQRGLPLNVQWVAQDYFGLKKNPPDPKLIHNLFAKYPNAVFLFCNVLGQLPVLLRENKNIDVEDYMKKLGDALRIEMQKNHIASYHDLFSTNKNKPNEIIDHLTGTLFADVSRLSLNAEAKSSTEHNAEAESKIRAKESFFERKEFPWRITKNEEHQIEFVRSCRRNA